MNTSRRRFIAKSAMAMAAATVLPGCMPKKEETAAAEATAASPVGQLTGVQLYSVRDEMKADPMGTLKALAEMGYQFVEHAGYADRKFYGWTAADFKKVLDDLGLQMPSGHTVLGSKHWDAAAKDFTDLWKYTVEDAAACGQLYVISPWLDDQYRKSADDLKGFMEVFNKSGELCAKYGMKYGYHNHDFEFSEMLDGKSLYDQILSNTDPNLVIQQLDIGNLFGGGAVALDVVKKWPGRFQSMHVKDVIATPEGSEEKYESTILGKGIVSVKEVIDIGKSSGGTIHFIIEQESYQGISPLDCVKQDLEIMKGWGY
jgi:sugar phosphate isomerase/epimerase